VHHLDLAAEVQAELPDHLRRQRDLGHEQNGALSPVERLADQTDIDLGLAAAGDAVEQRRVRRAVHQRPQALKGGVLRLRKHDLRHRLVLGQRRRAVQLDRLGAQHAQTDEPLHQPRLHAGQIAQLALRQAARLGRGVQHAAAARGQLARAEQGLGLILRHGRRDHAHGAGAALARRRLADADQARLGEGAQRRLRLVDPGALAQLARRQRLLRLIERAQQRLPGTAAAAARQRLLRPRFAAAVKRPGAAPDAGRKHGVRRLEKGAEILAAHPERQRRTALVQADAVVIEMGDGLERAALLLLMPLEDEALGPAIAAPEGSEDAHARPGRLRPPLGDEIIVGTVDGVDRRGHRHAHRHEGGHLTCAAGRCGRSGSR